MVRFRSHLLSGVELGVVVRGRERGQGALAQVDAEYLRHFCWRGIGRLDGQRDQQVEALAGPIIPEFGPAYSGPCWSQATWRLQP